MNKKPPTARYLIDKWEGPTIEIRFPGNPSDYLVTITPADALKLITQLAAAVARRFK